MSFFPAGMSTASKLGFGLDLAGKIGGLFGGSSDGVSGKAMGAERYQWGWQQKQLQEYKRQDMQDQLAIEPIQLANQYSAWKDWMYPIQQRQIQDRVNDAKSAGLHPLFALGQPSANLPAFQAGSISASTPTAHGMSSGITGQSFTGSHKQDKMAQLASTLMGLDQAQANIDRTHAETAYYTSLVAKNQQDADSKGVTVNPYIPGIATAQPLYEIQPDKPTAAHPSRSYQSAANSRPTYMAANMRGIGTVYAMQAENFGESLESTPWYMLPKLASDTYHDWYKLNPGVERPSFTRILAAFTIGTGD